MIVPARRRSGRDDARWRRVIVPARWPERPRPARRVTAERWKWCRLGGVGGRENQNRVDATTNYLGSVEAERPWRPLCWREVPSQRRGGWGSAAVRCRDRMRGAISTAWWSSGADPGRARATDHLGGVATETPPALSSDGAQWSEEPDRGAWCPVDVVAGIEAARRRGGRASRRAMRPRPAGLVCGM